MESSAYYYCVYGLRIASNQPVVGLINGAFEGPPNLSLEVLGAGAWNFVTVPEHLMLNGVKQSGLNSHSLRVWEASEAVYVRYVTLDETVEFSISNTGDEVRVRWTPAFPAQDVTAFFLGPVIGCVLRLRGIVALHAGVIAIDQGAVLLVGDRGFGKSTLVAQCANRGALVLSDDVAPLIERSGQFWVQAGYPRLRLWPAALSWFGKMNPDLPRVESIFDKRFLELDARPESNSWRFCGRPQPVEAIYLLNAREDVQAVSVQAETPSRGLTALLKNSYADYALNAEGRIEQFGLLARLASCTPIRRLHRPDDLSYLDEAAERISEDVRALAERRGA